MKKHTYEVTADVKSNGVERRRIVDVDADTTEEAIQIARDMRPNATLLNVKARRLEPDEDVLGNFWKKYEGTANSTQVCGITKRDNGFCVQYPTEFDANGDWKKENWRERWFATEAEAAQFAAEVPNSKADADEKILKAAMDYLEVSAQRMDNLDAMFRLMGLCENCGVSMVDAITVEKSIRRHFVKLYGADGRTAYSNFRAEGINRVYS